MDMPRGTGKTTILFSLSQENQCPVVTSEAAIKLYKDKYPNAIPMSYEEFLSMTKKPKRVYIDEIDLFLSSAFPDTKTIICSHSNNNDDILHITEFHPEWKI